jgi:SAM-dependent methyltransferase
VLVNNKKDYYFSDNVFEQPGYMEHYKNLLKMIKVHIDPQDFEDRTVLDLGCGYGFYGLEFLNEGANVIFADARYDNLNKIKTSHPHAITWTVDIEQTYSFPSVSLILCMGLLYHLGKPRECLEKIALATDLVIIDCTVADHDGNFIVYFEEDTAPNHFSFNGKACRPSPTWIKDNLKEVGFKEVWDISSAVGNRAPQKGYPGLLYDWKYERTCGWRRNEYTLRKMFIASK